MQFLPVSNKGFYFKFQIIHLIQDAPLFNAKRSCFASCLKSKFCWAAVMIVRVHNVYCKFKSLKPGQIKENFGGFKAILLICCRSVLRSIGSG